MKNFLLKIIKENPVFVLVLGTCPTIATSTSLANAIGMGLSATAVLICSNVVISLLKKAIPDKIRIAAYIVVIASFVTMVEMILKAYAVDIYNSLGLFIPLIVVNCIILGRAEAFASKNSVGASFLDGLSMGIGFTLALSVISIVRELFCNGTLLDFKIFGEAFQPATMFVMAPGGFIVFGIALAAANALMNKGGAK